MCLFIQIPTEMSVIKPGAPVHYSSRCHGDSIDTCALCSREEHTREIWWCMLHLMKMHSVIIRMKLPDRINVHDENIFCLLGR